jgi:CIC family chloride channel protein
MKGNVRSRQRHERRLLVGLRRTSRAALRLSLRLAPTERQRVFVLTILVGVSCGLAAVLFHLSIRLAEHALIDRALRAPGWTAVAWTVVTPALGALLVGLALEYVVPQARGSGIPQVKLAYAARSGRLRFRDAAGKFAACVLQIGSGGSLGREGPTVYVCAGTASALGRLFALSPSNLRRMLPVGVAAGIAAAFNAPIAAVTFTIEEIVGDLDHTVLSGVVVAAAIAAVLERSILGEHPVITLVESYGLAHVSSLLVYAALGLAAGVVALAFSRGLLALRARFGRSRLPGWARPALGGLVTGAVAAAVLGLFGLEGVTGGGYTELGQALRGELAVRALLLLGAAKLVATCFSYSSGGAGGIFAPTLFLGAMLGGAFGAIDQALLGHPETPLGAFALVGMGAVFAGVIRAPITSVLIIFEMTGSYGLVLPLMIANSIAYLLARRWQPPSIYEALLEQDGLALPHPRTAVALSSLRVEDAMTTNPTTVEAAASARTAAEQVGALGFSAYPVVDDAGDLVGMVSEARLRRCLAEGAGDTLVRALVRPLDTLGAGLPLTEAVVRMNEHGARQMAVVADGSATRLVGILAISDVMRAHARATAASEGRELRAPPRSDSLQGAPSPLRDAGGEPARRP